MRRYRDCVEDPNALEKAPETFEDALDAALAQCREVIIARQYKYGADNINLGGLPGVLVRVQDKVRRAWHACGLDALVEHGNIWTAADLTPRVPEPTDESADDPFIDMVGYGVIALMLQHYTWGLPMRCEVAYTKRED